MKDFDVYFHLQMFLSCFLFYLSYTRENISSFFYLLYYDFLLFSEKIYDYYPVLHFLAVIRITGSVEVKLSESILKNLPSCE